MKKNKALAMLLSLLMVLGTVAGAVNTTAVSAEGGQPAFSCIFKIEDAVYDNGVLTVHGKAENACEDTAVTFLLYSGVKGSPSGQADFAETVGFADVKTDGGDFSSFTYTKELDGSVFKNSGAVLVAVKEADDEDSLAFGAVSSYGAASVLGVPFILALLNSDQIITAAALSLVAGLGDFMPPAALAAIFAAQVIDEPNYFRVLKKVILPGLLILMWALIFVLFSKQIRAFLP